MHKFVKIAIVTTLVAATGLVIALKNHWSGSAEPPIEQQTAATHPSSQPAAQLPTLVEFGGSAGPTIEQRMAATQPSPRPPAQLPTLVEFGGKKCLNCRRMMPILEELKTEYVGKIEVRTVDVFEDPLSGRTHGIRVIPTQIFFDASGREVYRHEGFFSKGQILAAWAAHGVDLTDRRPADEED